MSDDDFDARAATWDDSPTKVERARRVAEIIRGKIDLRGEERLLEYGAGTALVTERLQGHVGRVTVADRSQGMLDVLRAKAGSGVLRDARVWDLDVTRDGPPDEQFDLIVSVMVLHHVPEVRRAIDGLVRMLAPDGHLCVVDLDAGDGTFHSAEFQGHDGFDRDEFATWLRAAGLDEVHLLDAGSVDKHGRDHPLFLAIASRGERA